MRSLHRICAPGTQSQMLLAGGSSSKVKKAPGSNLGCHLSASENVGLNISGRPVPTGLPQKYLIGWHDRREDLGAGALHMLQ